jgi:peptidoglycan/LPS O-acetylase OafA/YrhL
LDPLPVGYRNPQLDGLRGCAAMAVAAFHAILEIDPTQIQRILGVDFWRISGGYDKLDKIILALANGQTAVVVFFILSGAVLFDSLARRQEGPIIGSIDFAIRRFFRIYPALFLCLIIFTMVIVAMGGKPSGRQFWENALLLDNPIQGESWTLQVEMLAIPLVLSCFYFSRIVGVSGIVAVFALTWLLFATPWLSSYLGHQRTYTMCFVVGFLIPTSVGAWIAKKVPTSAWPFVLFVLIGARHLIPVEVAKIDINPVLIGLLFASGGLLVLMLYYGRAGSLGAFLRLPVLVYLGRLSYSFYLYNVIFIRILSILFLRYSAAKEHPIEFGLLSSALVIALTIPVARISEQYVERPTVRLGNALAIRSSRSLLKAAE